MASLWMHRTICMRSLQLKCPHVSQTAQSSLRSASYLQAKSVSVFHAVVPSGLLASADCGLRQFASLSCSRVMFNGISSSRQNKLQEYFSYVSFGSRSSAFHKSASFYKTNEMNMFSRSSRFLSKSPAVEPSKARTVQNDLPLLIGKRVLRRPKLRDSTARDQVTYYMANAFATAEEYKLETLREDIKCFGYQVVKLPEDALDALHIEAKHPASDEPRRIFFFREGSIVFWNVPDDEQHVWLQHVRPHQDGSYNVEMVREQDEQMDFTYCEDRTHLARGGDIELHQCEPTDEHLSTPLDMYAFSNALSLSVKLAVWEALLDEYVDSIEMVLQDLKAGKKIRMSEAEVLRKAGELFSLSHLINLSSDLLDTPDFYWDREDLGRLYDKTCNYLNIPRRTRVMNEKLGQCVEIIELLRDHLKDKHHTRLEWMIIVLIAVEVSFAVFHLIEEYFWNDKSDHV